MLALPRLPLLSALALPLALLGCTDDAPNSETSATSDTNTTGTDTGTGDTGNTGDTGDEDLYSATIRRTSHGVAHITADNWGGLAFGQAYAFTEDKGCLLADQIVKVRSERARWLGPG